MIARVTVPERTVDARELLEDAIDILTTCSDALASPSPLTDRDYVRAPLLHAIDMLRPVLELHGKASAA